MPHKTRAHEAFFAGFDRYMAPQGQLVVSHRGRRVLDETFGGSADLEMDLASLTKVLSTCYLVARARQYGLCELDDAISRFVPSAHDGVTLRHALEHSSGYPAHRRFDEGLAAPYGSREAYDECIRRAGREPLVNAPGTKTLYSDLGFMLLGAAVERMFAEPLRVLLPREVFGVHFSDGRGVYASCAHVEAGIGLPADNHPPGIVHDRNCRAMGGATGHAGLFGTARAVTALCERWMKALAGEDDAWLKPRFAAELTARSRLGDRATGWDTTSPGGHTGDVWPHDTIGHLGFIGTSVWMSPSAGLICTLLTNRRASMAEMKAFRREVYAAVWRDFGQTE
jgi:serine-type D-Ala-D-Ala carboxypeptidase